MKGTKNSLSKNSTPDTVGAQSESHEPPKRKMRARRPRAELEVQVVAAASRLFAEIGYQGTTVRAVAVDAGVALPVIYWFFPTKHDLYTECCRRQLKTDLQAIGTPLGTFTDPYETLCAFAILLSDRHLHCQLTKIIHRVLLDRDMAVIKILSDVFFDSEAFSLPSKACVTIAGKRQAEIKLFSLFSLVTGHIEHEPFWRFSSTYHKAQDIKPAAIALYALTTIFPNACEWAPVMKRVAKLLGFRNS